MADVRYIDVVELDQEPTGFHPLADKFPLMPDGELEILKADIAVNGLRNPPTLYEGLILDGRERYRACKQAGVRITRFGVYEGDDPAGFVLSQNNARRHMSHGALAMATAQVLQAAGRRQRGRWVRGSVGIAKSSNSVGIAKSSNSASAWQAAMRKAGVILDYGPSLLADLVVSEQWSLDKAFNHADNLRQVKPERSAEAKAKYEAAFKAYHECTAEYEAKEKELGEALAAACADAVGEEHKARGRAKKSAASPSPYVELARSIGVVAAYGRVGDADADGFNPDDLDPPLLARHFDSAELTRALCGLRKVIDWRARRDAAVT